jgi:hypothetical protein
LLNRAVDASDLDHFALSRQSGGQFVALMDQFREAATAGVLAVR